MLAVLYECANHPVRAHPFVNIEQVVQDDIAFSLVKADDLCRESSVHEQRLPASSGVNANDWMDTFDMLGTSIGIVAVQVAMR